MIDVPARSLASHQMFSLMQWRNKGIEEDLEERQVTKSAALGRRIVAEVGLAIIATVSLIETAVYGFFSIGECLFLSKGNRPFCDLLESSSFTLLWSLADIGYYNLFHGGHLSAHETAARIQAMVATDKKTLVREEDEALIFSLNPPPPDPILESVVNKYREIVIKGKEFLGRYFTQTLPRTNKDERIFTLAKSMWIYGSGPEKDSSILGAFSMAEKKQIEALRGQERDLGDNFLSAEAFVRAQNTDRSELFANIVSVASRGHRESLLLNRCWG